MSAVFTYKGLKIYNVTQVYRLEAPAQKLFADYILKKNSNIINIGYGFGFAHGVFAKNPSTNLILIENNAKIMTIAKLRHCRHPRSIYINDNWQNSLNYIDQETYTIFFDAFPANKNFNYSAKHFKKYIEPFIENIADLKWCEIYFIAFDKAQIKFQAPAGLSVSRVISRDLPHQIRHPRATRISLYRVSRECAASSQRP